MQTFEKWEAKQPKLEQFEGRCPKASYNAGIQEGLAGGIALARELLAMWMIKNRLATGHGESIEDLLKELDWQFNELKKEKSNELESTINED